MKDIREKVTEKQPKIRNPASRLPKELVRSAVLEAKEKSRELPGQAGAGQGEESPTEYAGNRIEAAESRLADKTGQAAYQGGKKIARKSRQAIQERRQEARAARGAKECAEEAASTSFQTGKSGNQKKRTGEASKKQSAAYPRIKEKPKGTPGVKEISKREVRKAPRMVKSSAVQKKIKTQTVYQKRQTAKAAKAAKQAAVKSAQAARQSVRTAKTTIRAVKAVAEAAVATVKAAFAALLAGGGALFLVLILIVGIIGGAAFLGSSQSTESLSAEVLAHTPAIQRYASEFGIPDYVAVIQAIMMQESGGQGTDPMQASECPYNTEYPNSPGAIQDADYSIKVGVQYYADCVREAGCESPQDMDRLKLSLQGYNYGNGYISWAIRNYGGYSEANALQFSQEQAVSHGWAGYGDPEYVPHVLRYYSGGGLFAGLFGNQQIVTIAKSQIGNEGGQKFWSWYGFSEREEWCACFVSWCADQSGLIASGAMPKFSLCSAGMDWFQDQGKWQAAGSVPTAGSIIFFDWNHDGTCDHVGIVESCDGTTVYTVEGNSGDAVRENSYTVQSASIMGYGIIV